MQITKIAFTRLLKLEVPQLAKLVLGIVEKHDPESLLIEKAYNDFNLLEPEIESLIVGYGPHPLTPRIEALRQERLFYSTSISFQVRGLVRGYISGTEESVAMVKHTIDLYLLNLRVNNEEIINERIDQFLGEVDANEELENALTVLGFSATIDELRSAHSNIKELISVRNASISKRPKGVTPLAIKSVRNGMRDLFARIATAKLDNKELDYNPLISELNEKLIRYGSLIKTRDSILKKKKEAPIIEDGSTEPTGMMKNMRVLNLGFDRSMDQKKADASSSKPSQLPPESNEA